ncbi:MAG: amidohydrolase [Novosphingobium sp.]|uniref:amidohydrolase n=1 Tax=Novosphingobium sp. TaxID=1874826 RepID=UPI001D4F4389|nr:amidohydrolase [Novosphingobium sp.]MCB2058438.1 amidohydrolase [Novosphingobium sp.]MCP5386961.1 amidohydrolase [Novosphingobium sp.]
MKARLLSFVALAALFSNPAQADPVRDRIAADMPGLMEIYRDLHLNPELSFQEHRSAKIMADAARKAGFEVSEGIGGTGVVAVLRNGSGPVVLIRADMDALPVIEQTGLPFASKARGTSTAGVESGIMHACGHDTHMTAWIETARVLAANRDKWSGTLMMIGQPAEERGLGALAMLEDPRFKAFPKPDYALAFHDSADLPSGVIGVAPGYALANVDSVDITVHGVGGHGAYPALTKDPIVIASAIVMRLQTLVSREHDPFDPAVVTVGSFHAGAKHNIISDRAEMQLTVRSYSDESRKQLLDGIRRIARAEAEAAGLPDDLLPEVKVEEPFTRSTYNTPAFSAEMLGFFQQHFGEGRAQQVGPVMAGEDFGEFARSDPAHIKSLIFWVGGRPAETIQAAKKEGKVLPGLHSPFWAPEADKVIATASEALIASTIRLMPAH